MENDYRITKLHGTLIGDNRIPDLPVGEKTKVFSSTNGKTAWVDLPEGGKSVSPILNLMDFSGELPIARTSITEEEKTNLEKGLYNSVIYADMSLGTAGLYSIYFPETAMFAGESLFFSKYNLSIDDATHSAAISSSSSYNLTIGEKGADGTYPITIEKILDASFGGGGGIQKLNAVLTISEDYSNITLQLDTQPSGEMFILSPDKNSGFDNVLMILQSNGNYLGFWSISDDTVVYYVKPDGTGRAFYSPTAFLFSAVTAHDGEVLTISGGAPGWAEVPRFKHTVTLKTSTGAILWTQTLSNSKNTPVNSYANLKTLFAGELLAGYGEYAQLDLRGGTEATDKLIKVDGTEATLASLGAIVYTDVCFLPK